jgi:hypothetical protein
MLSFEQPSAPNGQSVVADCDSYPTPLAEARFMLRAVGRNGQTANDLREAIMTEEQEEALLRAARDEDQDYAKEARRALEHRRRVLIEFDRLIAKRMPPSSGPSREPEPKGQWSCPECGRVFRPMTLRQFQFALKLHREQALSHMVA